MKSVKLIFTKKFYRGNLVDLTHTSDLVFVSMESAKRWLKGVKSNRDVLDYDIISYEVA